MGHMRLTVLDTGHRARATMFLRLTGSDAPDIVRTLLYRPEFFARPLLALTVPAMRGPSHWTAGEREYLAMRTAQLNQCPYCVDSHSALATIASKGRIRTDDTDTVRPELLAAHTFLDATGHGVPATVPDLPRDALEQALRVDLVWHVINRTGNAFGFTMRGNQLATGPKALHRFGYRFPGFLLAGGDRTDLGDPVDNLRHAVLDAPAVTSPARRHAAADSGDLPEPWRAYTALVRDASYRITDEVVENLGATEDEVYELTVAAAVGAALAGHRNGMNALTRATAE